MSLKKFGDDLPNSTIGVRREIRHPKTPGPGHYRPELADAHTRNRSPEFDWSRSPKRPEPNIDVNNGPGSIIGSKKFGDMLPKKTIGVRRETQIPRTPGPGEYRPETADGHTKARSSGYEWHKSPGRQEAKSNPNNGPGSIVKAKQFGDDLPNTTIGVRRDEQVSRSPGPGEYKHENADGLTKNRAPGYDWSKSPNRFSTKDDPNNGPGSNANLMNWG